MRALRIAGITPLALFLPLSPATALAQNSGIRVEPLPARPQIERDMARQYLNFDFALTNSTETAVEVEQIDMSVLDSNGRLVWRAFVSAKGAASPGLHTVPDRTIPPQGSLGIFNPFFALPGDLEIATLRVRFVFASRGIEPTSFTTIDVVPNRSDPATRLVLPVDGPTLVYDGHDFYSHHRRIPLGGALAKQFGLVSNPVRFANDLVPVGPEGQLARGALEDPTGWFAYGAVVRAPADGDVVSSATDVPDNRIVAGKLIVPEEVRAMEALRGALGNHVVIRHRDGEYSVLAHLLQGSVTLGPGDRVRQGAVVGRIGFSGDTGFHVHLHQMLTTGPTFQADGLPSYFDGVRRIALPFKAGSPKPVQTRFRLDTGDLVEAVR